MRTKVLDFNINYGKDSPNVGERIYKRENVEPGVTQDTYLIYAGPLEYGERNIEEVIGIASNIEVNDDGIYANVEFYPYFKWIDNLNASIVTSGYGRVDVNTKEVLEYTLNDLFLTQSPINPTNTIRDLVHSQLFKGLETVENFNPIWD